MPRRSVSVPARLEALAPLRAAVDALAYAYRDRDPAPTPKQLYAWGLAVYEAATNVVRHGHDGGSDAPLTLTVEAGDGEVWLRLADTGRPNTRWGEVRGPELSAEGGYGLPIILSLMDDVRYHAAPDGTNVLELHARFGEKEAP